MFDGLVGTPEERRVFRKGLSREVFWWQTNWMHRSLRVTGRYVDIMLTSLFICFACFFLTTSTSHGDRLTVFSAATPDNTLKNLAGTTSPSLVLRLRNDLAGDAPEDFLAGWQRQKIVFVFQRYDPAVQQFLRRYSLSAKVVDEQTTAIALELQWCFAGVAARVVADFQIVER